MVDKLKNNASWVLNRARVEGERVNSVRTSQYAWSGDFSLEPEDMRRIFATIKAITGLNTGKKITEALQVASYAVGTHYGIHKDGVTKNFRQTILISFPGLI